MAEDREKKAESLEEGLEPEDVEAHVKTKAQQEASDELDGDDDVEAHVKSSNH
jgi:hypothetical protein